MSTSYDETYPVVPNGLVSITWQAVDADGETSGEAITIANARSANVANTYTEIDSSVLSDTVRHYALGLVDDGISVEIIGMLRGLAKGDIGNLTVTTAEGAINQSGAFALSQATVNFVTDQLITTSCKFVRYRGKQ